MKNYHQFSPHEQRTRRYPFLIAIDLTVHFALSLAAIVLSAIAIGMCAEAVFPILVHIPTF